jgi:hypothetical protein
VMNPLNSLNTSKTTGAADLTQLVEQLARKADLNRDGQVSTSEFAQFLVNLLQGTSTSATASSTSTTPAQTPATTTTTSQLPPCPLGWDAAKWVNPDHNTPKYVVGRVLWKYPPTPAGLIDALPEVQKAIPGTTQVGDDKLDIPGVGIVDVGISFGAGGGVGWAWQVS